MFQNYFLVPFFMRLSPVSRQLVKAVGTLVLFTLLGTLGFWLLGRFYLPSVAPELGTWSVLDCLYMVLITISTAGFGEILPGMELTPVRIFTSLYLFATIGMTVYFAATMTTFFVEGAFSQLSKRRKMQKRIDALDRHIIVCGLGNTGVHVVKELMVTRWPVMVVDKDLEILKKSAGELADLGQLIWLHGDALEDKVLEQAGIGRAYGIVCSLPTDKGHVFLTLTARQMNPGIRIVSRAIDTHTAARMKIAGADSVVSTNFIGGMRLASEMVRPHVTQFLDLMLRDKEKNLRVEELVVTTESGLDGMRLGDARLREERHLLVLAIKTVDGGYEYGPGADFVLHIGVVLLVMGDPDSVARLRARMTGIPVVRPE
jgi:voltage-gated potassium channel